MSYKGKEDIKKTVIQISIGVLIASTISVFSILSKEVEVFKFYELIELKLLDQRFVLRGAIPMDNNLGTIDIDALSLGIEGRYQDWTRDKYAEVIRVLNELDARMIGFDVFFPEASASDILKAADLEGVEINSNEDVYSLFRDYDEMMTQSMIEAGNVLLGQSFMDAGTKDPERVERNTVSDSLKMRSLENYNKDLPEWKESGLPFFVDVETPLPKMIEASKGIGFAMTVADADGSVRHYPVVLVYNGKLWPSLALMMFLEYIDADFKDVKIVAGKEVVLPPGKLPNGEDIQVRIPLNEDGLMMVNWAGDYWDEQFFHIPHASIVMNQKRWNDAEMARKIKLMFNDNPEFFSDLLNVLIDPTDYITMLGENGIEWSEAAMETSLWMFWCKEIEDKYIKGNEPFPGQLPDHWEGLVDFEVYRNIYLELQMNTNVASVLSIYPDLTLEAVADSLEIRPPNRIRYPYNYMKYILDRGGLKPEDYPLYFFDPEVNGKILSKEDIKDKVFIYGLTAAGTHDLNPMPYNHRYPMVGLYANIFNMFLSNNFLERVDRWMNIFILFAFGLLMGVAVPRMKPLFSAIMTLALLTGYFLLAQYLFQSHGLWIDIFGPLSVILIAYTAITVYNFFSEEKEKKMIRGIFSRYVTKSVVDELIKNPDMVKLGGEKKILTVFFSDVAGFTTLSEQLEPEELVALLNEYLTVMSNIILRYDGMIDKYEGDAIMAVFGTPVLYPDHATRACYVSLEMQEELIKLREKWKEEGRPELYVRIGLNTGPMIAGNMGAQDRLDYTVMGDSVNLGSRLEGANKQYNTYIMISEFTYEVTKNDIEVRMLDKIRVKGKNEPVKVYELMGRKDSGLSEKMVEVRQYYEQGMEKYLSREWDSGIDLFNRALELEPEDGPSNVYRERCIAYKETPPPPDWDGVFTMTTK
ncbi:CHASE2 domain-containing protein [candidate division KSB1 bacterium]